MDGLIEGRVVHYILWQSDINAIEASRKAAGIFGNSLQAGEHVPAMIVKVWDRSGDTGTANLKVLLDGPDTFWATSRRYDDSPGTPEDGWVDGTWHWIEKA